ncbi:MAG: hypothetical protein QOF78_2164 [Phycisphaerales bacterium]|jgi:hypothetical protein|nr:hypothetical protein [Phycisphaerales bacterium]
MAWPKVFVAAMLVGALGASPANTKTTRPSATTATATTATSRAVSSTRRSSTEAAATAAVRAAVIALTKEYEQNLRSPGTAVRETSDYFKNVHDDTVTPDAIATALQSRGGDARTAAYVKWQLLSGLDNAPVPDSATAKQLLGAYRNAPQPIARPGVSPQDQQKLDVLVQGRKESDEADLKAYLDAAVSQVARQNTVILAYRDELYKKLPKTPETFAAAMDDLMQRLTVVAEDKALLKQLVADVREWATLETRPPHAMAALARAARKLADMKGPQYYQTPYWHSSNVFAWRKTRGSVDSASALKDLAVYLEDLAAQPKFEVKDNKKN